MSWEPKGDDHAEQLLQEHPDDEQVARAWPRRSGSDDRQVSTAQVSTAEVSTAQVVTADAVRAREPAPQEHPADERPVIDSPPLHDDRHPDQDDEHADETRPSFWRRHPFAVALGLLICAFAAAGGYLYWDYAQHFESTDDSFIAARQFALQPKVSGYITAVPVTDNQHVASGDVIARIDDRDYRIALDQANAQLTHDQAVLEQAKTNLGRFQYLVQRQAVAQQQLDDQNYLVEQDQATVSLDRAKVDAAQLNLSYTTVTAAQAGRVVSLSAAVGQFAQAGTTLTMFVPDEVRARRNLGHGEFQGDAARRDAGRTAGDADDRRLSGPQHSRPRCQRPIGIGSGVLAAAARKRHWQLGQDRAARAGQDRHGRPASRCRARPRHVGRSYRAGDCASVAQ
jgi:biotin carboxyl carrier protein